MNVKQAIRKVYPKLRRNNVVGIIHSGGVKRIYECCECHKRISMNARWPVTKRVKEFVDLHARTCGKNLIERANKLQ